VETVNADITGILALGAGLGMILVLLAQRYSMLEERRETRCPACGVIRRRGRCSCE
jgi:hypothetical protein